MDDGEATPADRPMPRDIKPSAVDMLHEEFAREKASALGRLGRALEAALDALARFDAGERRDTSPADARQLRATLAAQQAGMYLVLPSRIRSQHRRGRLVQPRWGNKAYATRTRKESG